MFSSPLHPWLCTPAWPQRAPQGWILRAWLSLAVGWMGCGVAPPADVEPHGPQVTVPTENPGDPPPLLGARREGDAVRLRVYSSRATRMVAELFKAAMDAPAALRVELTQETRGVWGALVPLSQLRDLGMGTGALYYGYRAWGPNWGSVDGWQPGSEAGFVADVDGEGNRFNPNKLLADPYARELSHDPENPTSRDGSWFASGPAHRRKDSGPRAPKAILLLEDAAWGLPSPRPRITRRLGDDIIYEVHVRGLTRSDPTVPAALRGTYAGAALKAAALAELGVTAVELLPVQETQNDANDVNPLTTDGDNYWGYMTLGYFAPDRRYAADRSPGGPTREWRAMVEAFHAHGLKVFVDVVYNHTGEGGAWGGDFRTQNLLSMRGLDNAAYYSLSPDPRYSWDNTGVGGNFNTFNRAAQNLIVDSLRYWHEELGVDGFRFDLAPVLGNVCEHGCFSFDKLNPDNALNRLARELPARPLEGGDGADLISEPWAFDAYQVGQFPAGWAEWNGKFRDTLRTAQNRLGVTAVTPGELATRLAGSPDLFGDDGRKPASSVNFLVAHDGFTLKDLYACNDRDNGQAWPFGPSDGGESHNLSWDQGADVRAQRQAARTGMALLMLSAGTPMMTGGDELLRTLHCNNNPYNVDSDANGLPAAPTAEQQTFRAFTQRLLAFRKAHPALRPTRYLTGRDHNADGMAELEWLTADGAVAGPDFMGSEDQHALAFRLDGVELHDPAAAVYVAYNAWHQSVSFVLPAPPAGKRWHQVMETCARSEGAEQFAAPGAERPVTSGMVELCGRAVGLLIAR